jgi:uncharacterized protein (TIGR02996 family)
VPPPDERAALYAAILEAPEEDGPRLVFADWLEEHGDESDRARAEFIRLQCRLARMNDWDEGYVEAKVRADRLFLEHREAWQPPAAPGDPERRRWTFTPWHHERGLPGRLQFSDDDSEADIRHWFAHLPITRADFYYGRHSDAVSLGLLIDPGVGGRLRELSPRTISPPRLPGMVDGACRAIAQLPEFSNLCKLALGDELPSAEALADVLAAPGLRRLSGLTVWGEGGQEEHFRQVARADLPELSELRVGRGLSRVGAAELAAARWFPRLTKLDLTANHRLGDTGLAALLSGKRELRLRSLNLLNCGLGSGAWAILSERGPASLVHLNVGHNEYSWPALHRLAEGPYRLEALSLVGNLEANQGQATARLFAGPAVARLRRVEWVGKAPGDHELGELASSPCRETLRVLMLKGANRITDAGVRRLCDAGPWPHLSHLDLQGSAIGPEAALALVEHPHFARLVSLELTVAPRAHLFVKKLADSPAAARLRALNLDVDLTHGAIHALVNSAHLDGLDVIDARSGAAGRRKLFDRFGPRLRPPGLFR